MAFDYDQLIALDEQDNWNRLSDSGSRAHSTDSLDLATSRLSGSGSGTGSRDTKGILALSEKLKTFVKKSENDKENLMQQIQALQGIRYIVIMNPVYSHLFLLQQQRR